MPFMGVKFFFPFLKKLSQYGHAQYNRLVLLNSNMSFQILY
jgi:hypothetical protein